MIQTKIIKYDRNNLDTFEKQINDVLEDIQLNYWKDDIDINCSVIDIKVINEQRVIVMYKEVIS
ncbi:hypothetical protein NGC87_06145 [Staphylococcus pseudoxylosus]|uniref:hypothetical protein n=1 Tax=Staphylococcus pseudoxylosus TaxID=2282419 RepID=UPI002DBB7DBE|nr:hypothetical protein [Staphylococcus pseudoxylosus]MEB7763903.1 hypothetical protein [Staphylococcus pseudoxylosus]